MTAVDRPIVIASNRGPVAHDLEADGSLTPQRGAGGLVTALAGALLERRAVWLAAAMTPGDREVAARGGGGDESMRYVVVDEERYDRYYHEVSNRLLWFVHHYLWDVVHTPTFDRGTLEAWDDYVAVNRTFAEALASTGSRGRDPRAGLPPRHGAAPAARAPAGRAHLALLAHAVRRRHVPADPADADAGGPAARDAGRRRVRVPVRARGPTTSSCRAGPCRGRASTCSAAGSRTRATRRACASTRSPSRPRRFARPRRSRRSGGRGRTSSGGAATRSCCCGSTGSSSRRTSRAGSSRTRSS